jgi:hypothetical protein
MSIALFTTACISLEASLEGGSGVRGIEVNLVFCVYIGRGVLGLGSYYVEP